MKKNSSDRQLFSDEIVSDVKKDFEERQKQRRPYELQWQLNINFVMGNQYCTVSGRGEIEQQDKNFFWQEKQVYNHIAPIVETRVARLSQVRPRPVVRPFSSEDKDVNSAKLSTKILDYATEKLSVDEAVQSATMWSEVCGTAFYKIVWDNGNCSFRYNGKDYPAMSDVKLAVCPPFEIYPDSNVCGGLDDCVSVIHAKAYPTRWVKDVWGADVAGEDVRVFSTGGVTAVGGLGYSCSIPSVTQETKSNHVMVIERYTRPDADNPYGKLEIVAGDKLLYYGELPYRIGTDGQRTFPFVRQVAYMQAGCFWGASVVERVIPVQRAYNAVKNRKHEFLNRLSMGILTVEDGSVDTENLEEEGLSPGKILVYRQGANRPSIMDNGNVPLDFTYEEDRLLNEFVEISGVSEFARNTVTPTNVTSGVALQLLSEQDEMRISSTVESIRSAIKQIARFILRLYKQFATTKRLIKIQSGNGDVEVYYFKNSDIASDDIVFGTDNQLTNSPTARKSMVMDLLNAGILHDRDGKLSESTKAKILTMLGFGNWESAQDLTSLHIRRAAQENLDIAKSTVLPVDDHALHIEEHTRFIISGEAEKTGGEQYRDLILQHIALHRSSQETV
nr:MAG TPA: portal [Caudoviricetes sp.]